jgi:cytochrome c oxidase subunit 2
LEFSVDPAAALSYRSEDPRLVLHQRQPDAGALEVAVTGVSLGTFEAYSRKVTITVASAAAGAQLYRNYSCAICHSTDGSVGHGPSYAGLFGRVVPLADGTSVKADEAYLLESIKEPNAKIVKGFPANFMPPYRQLQKVEYDSLVLFIKSLAQPE